MDNGCGSRAGASSIRSADPTISSIFDSNHLELTQSIEIVNNSNQQLQKDSSVVVLNNFELVSSIDDEDDSDINNSSSSSGCVSQRTVSQQRLKNQLELDTEEFSIDGDKLSSLNNNRFPQQQQRQSSSKSFSYFNKFYESSFELNNNDAAASKQSLSLEKILSINTHNMLSYS